MPPTRVATPGLRLRITTADGTFRILESNSAGSGRRAAHPRNSAHGLFDPSPGRGPTRGPQKIPGTQPRVERAFGRPGVTGWVAGSQGMCGGPTRRPQRPESALPCPRCWEPGAVDEVRTSECRRIGRWGSANSHWGSERPFRLRTVIRAGTARAAGGTAVRRSGPEAQPTMQRRGRHERRRMPAKVGTH